MYQERGVHYVRNVSEPWWAGPSRPPPRCHHPTLRKPECRRSRLIENKLKAPTEQRVCQLLQVARIGPFLFLLLLPFCAFGSSVLSNGRRGDQRESRESCAAQQQPPQEPAPTTVHISESLIQ